MSGGVKSCPSCGHGNSPDAMFCSKCGAKLPAKAPPSDPTPAPGAPATSDAAVLAAPPPEEAGAAPAETAREVASPSTEPSPSAPSEPTDSASLAGAAPASESAPADAAPAAESTPAADAAPARPRRRVAGAARTMLGVPAPTPGGAPLSSAPADPPPEEVADAPASHTPPKRVPGAARTMLGMPAPDAEKIRAAVEQAKADTAAEVGGAAPLTPPPDPDAASPAAASPAAASSAAAAPASPASRTAPGLGDGPPPAAPPKKRALDPTTNRTMLGQPAPRPAVAESEKKAPIGIADEPSGRNRAAVVYPADTGQEEALTLPTRKGGRGLAMAVLAIGVVALLVGGGALAWSLMTSGSSLQAEVVHGEDGEALVVEVPGAAEGTRVRFRGAEEALEAGRARFPLSADDLALGDNELSVDVVAPDGTVESHTVSLHLEMRVRADLGPLQSAPPAIDVVVEAPPSSEVTLDGDPLELDAQGRGTRRFPIDGAGADAEGVVEHVVRYRIHPPEGEAEQGELRTRIPLTTMQIDRPGEQVVTDRESVEVAGAVAPGSTVTVAGEAVEVRMGRFLHTVALPEVGERTIEVVARAAGKAPHVAEIRVRRVEDLEAEAARFEVNEELTYARIAQNPNTYRGQRVALDGLVYNVDVRHGRSVIQILVSDCPDGERCPLWVTYPAATDAEMRSRVRVLGTIAGEQQFRAQSGQVRTVPRVDATFVLPAEAGARRR